MLEFVIATSITNYYSRERKTGVPGRRTKAQRCDKNIVFQGMGKV